jgi:hypothetical protein
MSGEPLDFNEAFVFGAPMLAPENSVCEPPQDCAKCDHSDSCDKRQAALPTGNAEGPHKPVNGSEEAGRQVREEIYAYVLEQQKAGPQPCENPLPPLEEFHKYLTIDAAAADSHPSAVTSENLTSRDEKIQRKRPTTVSKARGQCPIHRTASSCDELPRATGEHTKNSTSKWNRLPEGDTRISPA